MGQAHYSFKLFIQDSFSFLWATFLRDFVHASEIPSRKKDFWSIFKETGKNGKIWLKQRRIFWGLFLFIFQITWTSERRQKLAEKLKNQ